MNYVVTITDKHPVLGGQFLEGPRTPKKVSRDGYGFTTDPAKAWTFVSQKAAVHKARIITSHMRWLTEVVQAKPSTSHAD